MDPIVLLKELVAIDSVNPSLVEGAAGEGAVARRLADVMRDAGLDVTLEESAPGRPNAIGVVEGRSAGRTLMFCGHLDTVGVAGMSRPFDPVERDGRLYGRGSQDMKGGVAAMVAAAAEIAAGGLEQDRLVVACVTDEEWKSIGADALVKNWRADAAVVTEPTDLQIGIAHKGFGWIEVETRGVAAHGSRPADGRDAIFAMGRLLAALAELDGDLQAQTGDARLGPASLHASTVNGGREWSTYPDRCVLQLERRTIPGEPDSKPLDEVQHILRALRERDAGFDGEARLVFARPPYRLDERAEIVQALKAACAARGRAAPVAGLSFWTDAAVLGASGIQTVIFGPGGAGLHSTEEYVETAEVVACRDILVELTRRYL